MAPKATKATKKSTTEGGASSSPPPPPFYGNEGMSSAQQQLFTELYQCPLPPTKFLDLNTLDQLQCADLTRQFLTKVGLEAYMTITCPTYYPYTYEFLTTIKRMDKGTSKERITFRLHQKTHTFTMEQLRSALYISKPPSPILTTDTTHVDFWYAVTGRDSLSNNDKITSLTCFPLRILSRFFHTLFFHKGGPTNVNDTMREYLWAMLPEGNGVPDWARLFVDSCIHYQTKKKGTIHFGGLITLLLKATKTLIPETLTVVPGCSLYDVKGLVETDMITVVSSNPLKVNVVVENKRFYMSLPRNEPLPSGDTASEFYCPPDDELENPIVGQDLTRVPRVRNVRKEGGNTRNVRQRTNFGLDETLSMQQLVRGLPQIPNPPCDTQMQEASSSATRSPWDQMSDFVERTTSTLNSMDGYMKNVEQWRESQESRLAHLEGRTQGREEAERAYLKLMADYNKNHEEERKWRESMLDLLTMQTDQLRVQSQFMAVQNQRHEDYLEDSVYTAQNQEDTLSLIKGFWDIHLGGSTVPDTTTTPPNQNIPHFSEELVATHRRAVNERERREKRRKGKGASSEGGSSDPH